MLTNQVHTPRSPGSSQCTRILWFITHGYRKSLQCFLTRLWYKDTLAHSLIPVIASRNSCAFSTGEESFVHSPHRDSEEAAYFSLPGARLMASISTCK